MSLSERSLLFMDMNDGKIVIHSRGIEKGYYLAPTDMARGITFEGTFIRVCNAAVHLADDYPDRFDYETIYFYGDNDDPEDVFLWEMKAPINTIKEVTIDFFDFTTLAPIVGDRVKEILNYFSPDMKDNK